MTATRIGFLGNCQIQTMAMLAPLMVDGAETVCLDYSMAESRDESYRLAFADQLETCDFVFAQLAAFSVTNHAELRARFGGKVVTMANFYFRGLFPDSCYVGAFGKRLEEPSMVNSVVVLDAFLQGATPEEAMGAFNKENYQRLGLLDAWTLSMREMRQRESAGSVDVPGADIMEQACLCYPAFLTMNHPSIVLLADYLSAVFVKGGLAHRQVNAAALKDPLAHHDTTPVDDVIAQVLQLPYRGSQRWRINALGSRFIDREEFIARFYTTYAKTPRETLLVHSPTDLVDQYSADPDLSYLVDPTAMRPQVPFTTYTAAGRSYEPSRIEQTLDAIVATVEETRIYTHKVHSFSEIADPKIENLSRVLSPAGMTPIVQKMDQKLETILNSVEELAEDQRIRLTMLPDRRQYNVILGSLVCVVVLLCVTVASLFVGWR
jgi:hypothetical protein